MSLDQQAKMFLDQVKALDAPPIYKMMGEDMRCFCHHRMISFTGNLEEEKHDEQQ